MTQQSVAPNPSVMVRFKKPVIADVNTKSEAKTYSVDDPRVVKAKRLVAGREYQPFVHGAPRGNVRVVENVTPNEDGSEVFVEFSSPHPAQSYKAAYRFWLVSDEPAKVVKADRTAGVDVEKLMQETPRPHVREVPEHLTHRPFADLKSLLER